MKSKGACSEVAHQYPRRFPTFWKPTVPRFSIRNSDVSCLLQSSIVHELQYLLQAQIAASKTMVTQGSHHRCQGQASP